MEYTTKGKKCSVCELSANLKIEVFRQKTLLNNHYQLLAVQDAQFETLSEAEKASVQECLLFKELEVFYGNITFEEYLVVQTIIEKAQRGKLIAIGIDVGYFGRKTTSNVDYENIFEKILTMGKNKTAQIATRKYEKMPEFRTIKLIGTGDFGKAFLIIKANEKQKFKYEPRKNLKGKKNLYIIKHMTYPEAQSSIQVYHLPPSLESELKFGYSLYHPNICQFYGAYSSNNFCILVYEYLCCGHLFNIINDITTPDDLYCQRIWFYSAQMILALEYLHERNIYHTDIKEQNICMDHRGYVKLIDFGMAIQNGQVSKTSGMVSYICKYHKKLKIEYPEDMNDKQYFEYYLNRVNNGKMYEIDVFGAVGIFFLEYAREYIVSLRNDPDMKDYNTENTQLGRIGGITCGFIADDEYPVPTAKELRLDYFYEHMDFTKLLLRGYNLELELQLDIPQLYMNYSTKKWISEQHVFEGDNKRTFLRKSDKQYLIKTHPSFHSIFSDLSEISK